MHPLSQVKEWCMDFLFPRSPRVLALENLSTEDLLVILPPAHDLKEKKVLALFDYSHTLVKELIWELKYSGNKKVANKLGSILYDTLCHELDELSISENWSKPILIPTPISDKRRFERGYNQIELLLEAVQSYDKEHRFKYLPRQLIKFRHTESQTKTSSKEERLKNLSDSMKVIHLPSVSGRYVVLIDDVVTTGSTFIEARRALFAAGVKKVLCIALAH